MCEERIWLVLDLFISEKASETDVDELAYLLGTHIHLLHDVKEFLNEYRDADPQITTIQKKALLARAEDIHREFASIAKPIRTSQRERKSLVNIIRHEGLIWSQLIKMT